VLGFGLGLRKPKQDLVLGSVWELTEYSFWKPRMKFRTEYQLCDVSHNFFLGNTTHSRHWYQGQKKVFLIVPVDSTLVRKDGVPPISRWDQLLSPNRNYFYNTLRDFWRILRVLIFRSKDSVSCMKTWRVKLSDDKLSLREVSIWPATENKLFTRQDVTGVAK
jgi:hypothetical protein